MPISVIYCRNHMKSEIRQTIERVVRNGLCTGCGTCVAICPNSAIEMVRDKSNRTYMPQLDNEKCDECGICLEACPGYAVDLAGLNLEVFGKEPEDSLLGNYIGCYIAHSTDSEIRYSSASGGLVTSLLIFALEQGFIDGALVTRMKKDSPLEPEPFIARTREDILLSIGSKYCPVPANIALREVLERDGKYAVVGLPCHIYGIRKAEAGDEMLRERIYLHFGIFCSHTVSFDGTEYLLRKLGIRSEEMAEISYRGGGWPGRLGIRLKNGGERFIPNLGPLWNSIFSSFFFTPPCCLSCGDVTNELADISFGDPWLPEIAGVEREGKSVVISRSERGETLLHAAGSKGAIELEAMDARDVIRSQRVFLHFKKVNINWRKGPSHVSENRVDTPSRTGASFPNTLISSSTRINSRIGSSRAGRFLLRYIPLKVLRMYTNSFYKYYSKVINKDFDKAR